MKEQILVFSFPGKIPEFLWSDKYPRHFPSSLTETIRENTSLHTQWFQWWRIPEICRMEEFWCSGWQMLRTWAHHSTHLLVSLEGVSDHRRTSISSGVTSDFLTSVASFSWIKAQFREENITLFLQLLRNILWQCIRVVLAFRLAM